MDGATLSLVRSHAPDGWMLLHREGGRLPVLQRCLVPKSPVQNLESGPVPPYQPPAGRQVGAPVPKRVRQPDTPGEEPMHVASLPPRKPSTAGPSRPNGRAPPLPSDGKVQDGGGGNSEHSLRPATAKEEQRHKGKILVEMKKLREWRLCLVGWGGGQHDRACLACSLGFSKLRGCGRGAPAAEKLRECVWAVFSRWPGELTALPSFRIRARKFSSISERHVHTQANHPFLCLPLILGATRCACSPS